MTFWRHISKPGKVVIILLLLISFLQAPVPTLFTVVVMSVVLEVMVRHLYKDSRYEEAEK